MAGAWWRGDPPRACARAGTFFFQNTHTHTQHQLFIRFAVYNENRADLWEILPVGCYFGTRCDCDICQVRQARYLLFHSRLLQCVAAYYSMLQSVAECCTVLQCVTVCYSVLECAAVCCIVLQYLMWPYVEYGKHGTSRLKSRHMPIHVFTRVTLW